MKRYLRRIGALLIATIMVLSMCLTVFAAEASGTGTPAKGTSEDKGTITVKGVEEESDNNNITVTAYPIVTAKYDESGFAGYNNLYGIKKITAPTVEELSDIASRNLTGDILLDKQSDGSYVKSDMSVGMYLICVTGTEAHFYNVAVASINYVNKDGDYVITPGEVTMVKDGAAWVKKTDKPNVTKKILKSATKTDDGLGGTANIGDEITYEVSINPIPNYQGKFPKLEVVDTLDAGLTYVEDSLKVTADEKSLQEKVDYTVDISANNVISVNFVVNDKYMLNDYTGKKAVITYKVKVGERAAVNENSNKNSVVLNYTKDSKTNGNDTSTPERKTYTYTFEIDGSVNGKGIVTKTGEDEAEKALKDAVFGLYKDGKCENLYKNTVFEGTATSDDAGQIHMKGLAEGTYYLKEISAPAGYSVNNKIYTVAIEAKHNDLDGTLERWTVTIDGKTAASFEIKNEKVTNKDSAVSGAEIKNTKLNDLPSTGGMGTYLFTITGVMIMAAVTGMFLVSRRKEHENQ